MKVYDIGILGAGVAGSFATYKICTEGKNNKVAIIDSGRPPLKRRRQMEGWLGCLPTSDGKFYLSDVDNLKKITTEDKINNANNYFNTFTKDIFESKINKSKKINKDLLAKLKLNNFTTHYHNYFQIFPKEIHAMSKIMNNYLEDYKNLDYYFDEEISNLEKAENGFIITTQYNKIFCKNILLSIGRSGWRFTKDIFNYYGLVKNDSNVMYGVRAELGESLLKDFNKAVCSFEKDNIFIDKLSWGGTTIQEDHMDLSLSSYRSNENRWKTEKVSFNILNKLEENSSEECERIAKLSFLLANDRVIKEKISLFKDNKSKISPLKEFNWLNDTINDLDNIIDGFSEKGYMYYPTLKIQSPKINIDNNFKTEIDGLYVAGESSGYNGLLYSLLSGLIFADNFI